MTVVMTTTATEDEQEYPSAVKALLDSDAVVNLWCGVKWLLWQGSHLLILLLGLLMVVAYAIYRVVRAPLAWLNSKLNLTGKTVEATGKAGSKTAKAVGGAKERTSNATTSFFDSPKVKKVVRGVIGIASIAAVVGGLGFLLHFAITSPMVFFAAIGIITTGVAVIIGLFWLGEYLSDEGYIEAAITKLTSGASSAATKAKETPGVRRVYGNCPVHFDIEPKWFESLISRIEKRLP